MAGMASAHNISRLIAHHVSVGEISVENKVQVFFIVPFIAVQKVSVAVYDCSDVVPGLHSAFQFKGFDSRI